MKLMTSQVVHSKQQMGTQRPNTSVDAATGKEATIIVVWFAGRRLLKKKMDEGSYVL